MSAPVARISCSACGRMRLVSTGVGRAPMLSGRPSHCSALNTVKRLRKGIARFLAPLIGAVAHVVGDEAVGIDDGGAALALAHVPAEPQRLLEGEPGLPGKAVLDDGCPENEDVDAAIGPTCGTILRHRQRCAYAR